MYIAIQKNMEVLEKVVDLSSEKVELPQNSYRMSITSACNMKCEYCHNEGNKIIQMLSKEDIELLVKNSKDFGIKEIRLTGGEPLIHPQIEEICQMLTEKYHLKVGINTNCVEFETLKRIIKNGWVHRVVVGLDYFDGPISKMSSVGKSSKEILEHILEIKKLGCNISISKVYTRDFENTLKLIDWAIKNDVRIKILEVVKDEECEATSKDFVEMRNKVIKLYNLDVKIDEFHEWNGYQGDKRVITFFHSHCRLRECDICKKIHLRVTSTGKLKQCMYHDEDDIDYRIGNVYNNIARYLTTPAKFYKSKGKTIIC